MNNPPVNWFRFGFAVLLGIFSAFILYGLTNRTRPAPIVINPAPTVAPDVLPTPAPIIIFVNGAVNSAGTVSLEEGARVADAIEAAGGFSAEAYTDNINLAAQLSDGMQIFVSSQSDAAALQNELLAEPLRGSNVTEQATGVSTDGKVNINTANLTELETIPGVGPATAESIRDYREENGLFANIEEIMLVPGIGEGKFEDMQESITVGDE